jgi:cellobiose phosphorylase
VNSDAVWDGAWYRRLLRPGRTPLGSAQRREGRIYLNAQSWAVMGGAAAEGRGVRCMDEVYQRLNTPSGVLLFAPPYTGYPEPEDRLVSNGPGAGENGGIFCHANTWAIIAECLLGRGDYAFEYYRKLLPSVNSRHVGIETYRNEPYAYSSWIYGPDSARAGEAQLSWLSGTVAWMYIAATHYILGLRPRLDGLLIEPCIPRQWKAFSVRRKFRGKTYEVRVSNPSGVSGGVKRITVDGADLDHTLITPDMGGQSVQVLVELG